MKNKYVFIGDDNSINIELICNSFKKLKSITNYIIIGEINNFRNYQNKIGSKIEINEILNPYDFSKCKSNKLNFFNIPNDKTKKIDNLINQINISNFLCNKTKNDLITMPINKFLFKKDIEFNGMTEYLGKINSKKTIMLMYGEKFSIIPITTHINPKDIHKIIKKPILKLKINEILKLIKFKNYRLNFKEINFICYNPHCGEKGTIGKEDLIIRSLIKENRLIKNVYPADSAFNSIKSKSLYISTYHDQALIPFKILNKKGLNLTLGLNYRRISPAHGTATGIKYKKISNNESYISCMKF